MSSAEYSYKLFKPIFAYGQTVWTLIRLLLEEQSDLGPHCLQKWLSKSQDKADDNCCDWQFKGLIFTILWENSADYEFMIFSLFSPENRLFHFMQIVSKGDYLNEVSKPIFWEK